MHAWFFYSLQSYHAYYTLISDYRCVPEFAGVCVPVYLCHRVWAYLCVCGSALFIPIDHSSLEKKCYFLTLFFHMNLIMFHAHNNFFFVQKTWTCTYKLNFCSLREDMRIFIDRLLAAQACNQVNCCILTDCSSLATFLTQLFSCFL